MKEFVYHLLIIFFLVGFFISIVGVSTVFSSSKGKRVYYWVITAILYLITIVDIIFLSEAKVDIDSSYHIMAISGMIALSIVTFSLGTSEWLRKKIEQSLIGRFKDKLCDDDKKLVVTWIDNELSDYPDYEKKIIISSLHILINENRIEAPKNIIKKVVYYPDKRLYKILSALLLLGIQREDVISYSKTYFEPMANKKDKTISSRLSKAKIRKEILGKK